ncbi:MAG: polysaccharide biosynthesis protein [Gammaproteobacteria bacterium]|nr:polysaccharide biosynthesis protein [Gammaproteobacteria bacterium]
MSVIKKLASQTAVYGLSSIFGRFLNYLLVPLYTYYFSAAEYGVVSEFYAYAGFFSVLLLFGFDTGYFRFHDKDKVVGDKAYGTALWFILLINCVFFGIIWTINPWLSALLNYAEHPEYVLCFSLILIMDAIASIPFARLRAEDKAFRFAGIKIVEILITVGLSLLFIKVCPMLYGKPEFSWVGKIYDPAIGVGYIFIANLIASVCKFFMLAPQLMGLSWGFDKSLFPRMFRYSLPMVVIGFAGIINEMLDRVLLKQLLPYDMTTNMKMLGIYSACYKLSILMSLFIQAFRFAAEPFFFAYADKNDSRAVYAKVLKYFVIFCVFIFLLVTLFIDFFKYFVGPEFRSGLDVVPILLVANLFLGIYVNLSIWYKLTDRTLIGACVSLAAAALTIYLNIIWIPVYGYMGSAWAHLIGYAGMAVVSYGLGQIYYPVKYDVLRILAYIGVGLDIYQANEVLKTHGSWPVGVTGALLLMLYIFIAALFERRDLLHMLGSKTPPAVPNL